MNEITIPKNPTGLRARGRRLWREMHETADFTGCPEAAMVLEQACRVADEIERQHKLIAKAGDDTRVMGSTKQPVSMPEIGDLRSNQALLLSLLKAINPADENTLTRSDFGRMGAAARWQK
jgi:hypothetical protein